MTALWTPCVSLAGGHPSLLLDSFSVLLMKDEDAIVFQETVVQHATTKMVEHHRVKELSFDDGNVTHIEARNFVLDVLTRRQVQQSEHALLFDMGIAWFLPKERKKSFGSFSSPPPQNNGESWGMFATAAKQINLPQPGFVPHKSS